MSSRLRGDAKHVFEVFLEIVKPGPDGKEPWIYQTYPSNYKNTSQLKSVPQFVFPCDLEILTVQHFSFVLTNDDAKWTFGFCRIAPNVERALIFLSSLPWHETFYRILNEVADIMHSNEAQLLTSFLEAIYVERIPDPDSTFLVSYGPKNKDFTATIPNTFDLPSIPENRNLTEYYNAVGIHSMLVIFASMLYERRIIVVSKKLSRLSACVQAANAILYPMQWQHIYIPILSQQLIDYVSAPMPFLIGVPSPLYQRLRHNDLGDVVILDADENTLQTPFRDLENIPTDVTATLKKTLKNHKDLLGDSVSRAFLHSLVHLIGGYRDALKFRHGEKIKFSHEAFIFSRSPPLRPFLEEMLHFQIFRQFIESRLEMLNNGEGLSDEFEKEAVSFSEKSNNSSKYTQMSSVVRKEGGALVKAVKNKTNPGLKLAVRSVKDGSKQAYKELRSKMNTGSVRKGSSEVNSAPCSPTENRNSRSLSVDSSSSALPALLRNNTDVNLISNRYVRKYERFDSSPTDIGKETPDFDVPPSPLDLDLLNDLQDMIYANAPPINRRLKPQRGSRESSTSINSLILNNAEVEVVSSIQSQFTRTRPVAPPRGKRSVIATPSLAVPPSKESKAIIQESDDLIHFTKTSPNSLNFDPLYDEDKSSLEHKSSRSSEDLLHEYGIDFKNLSGAVGGGVSGSLKSNTSKDVDILTELDPLKINNYTSYNGNTGTSARINSRQMNWTTFD